MFTQRILTDEQFQLKSVIESHGWYQLPPFEYDATATVLARVQRLADGRIIRILVQPDGNTSRPAFLLAQTEGEVYPTDHAQIDAIVRRMLCLDWNMSAFYTLLRDHAGYAWVENAQAGRILRSATVWEDLAKTLLTTNTTWRQTIGMVQRLVTLGDHSPLGYAFPTPEQVAVLDVETLTTHVKCGYRGAYLHELASRIASGELDVEAWLLPEVDSTSLYKAIRALKGFGDYAAASTMRLLGHHDRVSIDSVCRDMFMKLHSSGSRPTDAQIRAHYSPFGRWGGLVMWMDVIRDDYIPG